MAGPARVKEKARRIQAAMGMQAGGKDTVAMTLISSS